jgi:predicted restriction endonuclease
MRDYLMSKTVLSRYLHRGEVLHCVLCGEKIELGDLVSSNKSRAKNHIKHKNCLEKSRL